MRYDRTLHLAGQPDENVGAGDASQHVLKRAGVKTTPVEPRDDMQDALIVEASVLHGSPLAVAHALRIGMQECACTVRCAPLCFFAEAGDRAFRGGLAPGVSCSSCRRERRVRCVPRLGTQTCVPRRGVVRGRGFAQVHGGSLMCRRRMA